MSSLTGCVMIARLLVCFLSLDPGVSFTILSSTCIHFILFTGNSIAELMEVFKGK